MAYKDPHPQTIFHLVPQNSEAKAVLAHADNQQYVSLSKPPEEKGGDPELALEIGYHVSARPGPEVIVEVGRNADLVLPASSISAVQFSFETHPESKAIMFHDRSRLYNTIITPFGLRTGIRQHVLQPGMLYEISAGGARGDLYCFELWWVDKKTVLQKVERGRRVAEERAQNPRWARTVEEEATELSSWYKTRLPTPADGGVQRTTRGVRLGQGSYGEVRKAIDLDSGYNVAVKSIALPDKSAPSDLESSIWREVKTLSTLSHKNIVEYLGSNGWGTKTVYIYTSLKPGNVNNMLEQYPNTRLHDDTLSQLLQQMLEALDYLAFRGLCHRDVKPDNILYTPIGDMKWIFQLADFGLANQQDLARTYCGTPMFVAPEIYYHQPQTTKLDVWSLFVTIASIRQPADFDEKRLKGYEDVLNQVRTAATNLPALNPMAREDPALRASAAQMLVQYFQGGGLTTPRARVGSIPVPGDGLSRLPRPSPSDTKPKAPVRVDAIRKRGRLASPKPSMNHRDKAHSGPAKDRVRKDERSVPGAFPQFA